MTVTLTLGRKHFICIVIIVAIVLFLAYMFFPVPDHQLTKENFVKIRGSVEFSGEGPLGTKPQTVTVYSPYSNPYWICRGDSLGAVKIDWTNENEGRYELPIRLPVDMEVVITTNCSGCQHVREFITTDEKEKTIGLKWDGQQCEADIKVPEDMAELLKRANSYNQRTEELRYTFGLTKEQSAELSDLLNTSARFIADAEREDSLSDAYGAIGYSFYAWRNLHFFDLNNCVKEIETLIDDYNTPCYQLPYDGYKKFQDVKNRYEGQVKQQFNMNLFYEDDLNRSKQQAVWLANNLEYTLDAESACAEPLNLIKESLELQEPYCENRKNINYALYFTLLVLGIAIGSSAFRWLGE
jgi:hypothetical protein